MLAHFSLLLAYASAAPLEKRWFGGLSAADTVYYMPSIGYIQTTVNNSWTLELNAYITTPSNSIVGYTMDRILAKAFSSILNRLPTTAEVKKIKADFPALYDSGKALDYASVFIPSISVDKPIFSGRTYVSGILRTRIESTIPQNGISTLDYYIKGPNSTDHGSILLLKPQGISVICDIDASFTTNSKDTIKDSGILNKTELLQNVLLRDPRPTPGSESALSLWAKKGFAFHYVSASPQYLAPNINGFLNSYFPKGSVTLKDFAVLDGSILSLGSAESTETFKGSTTYDFMKKLPNRKFVLVGDSTERG